LDLLTRFQIPQLVPLDSSISISDLSAAAGLPEDILARGIRYGIANGLFREIAPNQISHSSASAELHNNSHLRNVVHFGVQFLQRILMSTPSVMALKEDKNTDQVPETAFNLAYNTEENLFEYFAHSKDLNAKYHDYLIGRVNTPLWSMDRLRAAWDWASLGPKTIVDVGFLTSGCIYRRSNVDLLIGRWIIWAYGLSNCTTSC
jgi:6-hydroxytryprostatin B O-methyltransferase